MLTSSSPSKSPNCFQGELTDGDAVILLLGFDEGQRLKLQQFLEENIPVTRRNCQSSLNSKENKFQIVVTAYTNIEKSSGRAKNNF